MLKPFCDKCHNECQSSAHNNRRFDAVAFSLSGKAIGLEVLLLLDKQQDPGIHICDDCIPELLNSAIDKYSESPLVKQKFHWATKMHGFEQFERDITRRVSEVESREQHADATLEEAIDIRLVSEKQHQADMERIRVLQAQVSALQHADESRIRSASAQTRQQELDSQHYPEYIERVEEREKRRRSA